MQKRNLLILLTILILVIASLSCGLFGGDDEAQENPSQPDQQSDPAANYEKTTELDDEGTLPVPDIELGNEYRSEAGGYAFRPVPNYEMEEFFGLASLVAPDADPDLGPMLMLIGGTNEEESTKDEIFESFMQDAESEDVEILDQKDITVDGKPGILADIAGDVGGQQVVGRIVVVAVNPNHQFTLFASAPKDRWNEIRDNFNAVLATVHFFEPQEIDFSEEFESEGESQEIAPSTGDFPSFGEFPSNYSELPAGGFVYLLATSDGELPVIIDQGRLQDQSTEAEYILGLVSADERHAVTLFIPIDLTPGILVMTSYDDGANTHGPGASVYKNLTQFTNTDGMMMIEEMQSNTISGTFAFMALDEAGNELSVTGYFNQLPLPIP